MGARVALWSSILQSPRDVQLNTTTELARAQLRENRAFAEAYQPRSTAPPSSTRPRVLVSGFGRFLDHPTNATGQMVSRLVPGLDYPVTEPVAGRIDPPGPQLVVAQGLVELPTAGEVELCVVVLPVFWDLAAYLVLREIEVFAPQVVVMNGVAGPRQKLWLELGAFNQAKDSPDGSSHLKPSSTTDPIIERANRASCNHASWRAIESAAAAALAAGAAVMHDGERLDAIMPGVAFAGFPRATNTYLCNQTTFVVGHALDHPGEPIRLLQSGDDALEVTFATRGAPTPSVPRWFMHWPGALGGAHLDAAADVLCAVLGAQVTALIEGPAPTRGDNALAEIGATP